MISASPAGTLDCLIVRIDRDAVLSESGRMLIETIDDDSQDFNFHSISIEEDGVRERNFPVIFPSNKLNGACGRII